MLASTLQTGGIAADAPPNDVNLVRYGAARRTQDYKVNVDQIIEGKKLETDQKLLRGDVFCVLAREPGGRWGNDRGAFGVHAVCTMTSFVDGAAQYGEAIWRN